MLSPSRVGWVLSICSDYWACPGWKISYVPPWHGVSPLQRSRQSTEKEITKREREKSQDEGQRMESPTILVLEGKRIGEGNRVLTDTLWIARAAGQRGAFQPAPSPARSRVAISSNTCPLEQVTLGTQKMKEKGGGIKGDYYNSQIDGF